MKENSFSKWRKELAPHEEKWYNRQTIQRQIAKVHE